MENFSDRIYKELIEISKNKGVPDGKLSMSEAYRSGDWRKITESKNLQRE